MTTAWWYRSSRWSSQIVTCLDPVKCWRACSGISTEFRYLYLSGETDPFRSVWSVWPIDRFRRVGARWSEWSVNTSSTCVSWVGSVLQYTDPPQHTMTTDRWYGPSRRSRQMVICLGPVKCWRACRGTSAVFHDFSLPGQDWSLMVHMICMAYRSFLPHGSEMIYQ